MVHPPEPAPPVPHPSIVQPLAQGATVAETLAARGQVYGTFAENAEIAEALARIIRPKNLHLAPDQRQALEVIGQKISRILSGNPNYVDNWLDIAGYATLVADRLKKG